MISRDREISRLMSCDISSIEAAALYNGGGLYSSLSGVHHADLGTDTAGNKAILPSFDLHAFTHDSLPLFQS